MKSFLISLYFSLYNWFAKRVSASIDLPEDAFEAIAKTFDAIWVLTIPRNTARQDFIKKEFAGLPFQFVNGVDGQSLTPEDSRIDLKECERRNHRPVRINEMACTLSHLVMYQKLLDSDYERVLIFEDDAVFDRRKATWVSYILARLPADWDLVYLGYRDGELRGPLVELQEALGRKRDPHTVVSRSVHRGIRTAAAHDFTHAYAVSREGARKLLEGAYPIHQTADGFLEEAVLAGKIRAYSTVPKLFLQQEDLGSSIHNRSSSRP